MAVVSRRAHEGRRRRGQAGEAGVGSKEGNASTMGPRGVGHGTSNRPTRRHHFRVPYHRRDQSLDDQDPDIGGRVQVTTPKVSLDLNSTVEEQQSVSHMGIRRGLPSLGERIMQLLAWQYASICILASPLLLETTTYISRAQSTIEVQSIKPR